MMIDIRTMEDEGLVTSFSKRHKVLALAMSTVFIGSASAKAKVTTAVDVNEPLNSFTQAYREYASAIRSGSSVIEELVDLAEQTYELGKVKFGSRHHNTFLLQQNLANAYLEAGEYELSAAHYETVIDYYDETQGDDSQSFYFALLDIINLLYSADKAKKLSAEDIGIELYGCERAILQLLNTSEDLVAKMPESSLIFRAHTVKTAIRSKWSHKNTRLLNMAKQFQKEAKKSLGVASVTYLEAQLYVGKVQLAMDRNKDALLNFEAILEATKLQGIYAPSISLLAHAHLVTIYAKKKDAVKAIFHSQAAAKNGVWNDKHKALYQVAPKLPKTKTTSSAASGKIDSVKLMFDISSQGQAINIQIKDSSTQLKAESAMTALKQWYFVPKLVNDAFVMTKDVELMLDFVSV